MKFAPVDTPKRKNSYWLAPFVLREELLTVPVSKFVAEGQAEGAQAYAIFWPEMYKEEAYTKRRGFGTANYPFDDPAHRRVDYAAVDCPNARAMARATIAFWTHPTYTLRHMAADVRAFEKVAERHMK